jgi:hypothetical protein
MTPHDEASVEGKQEVLADRLDPLERAAVDALGDPERGRPRVRRLGRDDLSFEGAEPLGRAMEAIPFGHASARTR